MQGIAVRAGAHNGLVHGLFVAAETVAAVGTQLGEERGDVLRGGYGELVERLRLSHNRAEHAHVDAADALRRERVLLALAVAGGEAQRKVLHGQLPLPLARRAPGVALANDARRGAHRAIVYLHRLRQQRHHVANRGRVARRERQFAVGREGVVDAHRGIEHGLGVVEFVIVQSLQCGSDARTEVETAVLGMNLEAGVETGTCQRALLGPALLSSGRWPSWSLKSFSCCQMWLCGYYFFFGFLFQ